MKKLLSLFSLLFISLSALKCEESTSLPCEESDWLEQRITAMKVRSSWGKGLITQYYYKDQSVILIDDCSNCNDAMQVVYDCNGNVLCQFGGIAGLNTCPDFGDTAVLIKVIFELN